jgi:hypothetical protein
MRLPKPNSRKVQQKINEIIERFEKSWESFEKEYESRYVGAGSVITNMDKEQKVTFVAYDQLYQNKDVITCEKCRDEFLARKSPDVPVDVCKDCFERPVCGIDVNPDETHSDEELYPMCDDCYEQQRKLLP